MEAAEISRQKPSERRSSSRTRARRGCCITCEFEASREALCCTSSSSRAWRIPSLFYLFVLKNPQAMNRTYVCSVSGPLEGGDLLIALRCLDVLPGIEYPPTDLDADALSIHSGPSIW